MKVTLINKEGRKANVDTNTRTYKEFLSMGFEEEKEIIKEVKKVIPKKRKPKTKKEG
jgi:hypothetical protein